MISDNIRFLREKRKLSQRELAEILGVSNKTVSKWETGAGLPDIQTIVPLSMALGVSTDAILKERPAPAIPPDKPLERRQQIQEGLQCLHEQYRISVSQLLTSLGMKESEWSALLMNSFPATGTGAKEQQDRLVKLLVILRELIPLYVENPSILISSLYLRLRRDNELCEETVESYAGLEPGTLERYLSGRCSLSPKQMLSLTVTLFLLDQAFNPEDAFPRDS